MDANVSIVSLTEFDGSFSVVVSSTPHRTPSGRRSGIRNVSNLHKSPGRRLNSRPPVTCGECGKKYVSERAYNNHVRLHSVEKLAYYQPSTHWVMSNLHILDQKVLEKCLKLPMFGPTGEEYKSMLAVVQSAVEAGDSVWSNFREEVCRILLASIQNSSVLLPSQLSSVLLATADKLLSASDSQFHLASILSDIHPHSSREILLLFISDYVMEFVSQLLKFVLVSARGPSPAITPKEISIDNEDEQVIFYCGGAVLRGFLNMGRRHPKNRAWHRITECIKSNLLESDGAGRASDQQKQWTEKVDRGALLKISAKSLYFFIEVTKCCAQEEQVDGSLSYECIIQRVLCSGAAALWDEIVQNSLSPSESLNLMYALVKSFSQTCGNGIARRRINQHFGSRATTSVSLRHRIAPK